MRILVTGKNGQVGSALQDSLSQLGEVHAVDRAALDIANAAAVAATLSRIRPDVVVNAAAYTAVDRAESERELAFAVNARAAGALAEAARSIDALLVHFSTDYVFDGAKTAPYTEDDPTAPLNVYGESKLAGEQAVVTSGCRYLILRTSWVYGPAGRNFLQAILNAASSRPELRVVDDQHGAPTSSLAIADALAILLSRPLTAAKLCRIYHLSAAGETTWFGFAREILQRHGLSTPVVPISSGEYAAPARRPRNSRLDNSRVARELDLALPSWREQLEAVLARRNAANG